MAGVLEVTEDNYEPEIIKPGGVALLDFWAPWCGPCRIMHPVIEALGDEFEGRAVIARCNVDENPSLAGRFSVTAIPTLVIIKAGNAVETMVGASSQEAISQKIQAHL